MTWRLLATIPALALTVLLAGCGRREAEKPKKEEPAAKGKEEHGHEHDGPFLLFAEPNHHFHLKLMVHADEKEIEATVLDESAKVPVPIAAETITVLVKEGKGLQIPLKAKAEKGKKSAEFAGTHDRLAAKLDPHKVEISAEVNGKAYIFTIDEDHAPKKK